MDEIKQFIYFLELIPHYLISSNWTDIEDAIIEEHFNKLQNLLNEGKLILAGRTLTEAPNGIVILEVNSLEEARELMENDPAVKKGLMKAKLYPYRVALLRNLNDKK